MAKRQEEYYQPEMKERLLELFDQGFSARASARTVFDDFNLPFNEGVERNYRRYIQQHTEEKIEDDEFGKAQKRKFDKSKKRFIISWAQVDSPIHEDFLTNIEAYADYIDAAIHVIAGRYKAVTSLEGSKQQKDKEKNKSLWHPRLTEYLDANRQNLHEYLAVLADVKLQPTASVPLSGFNSITGLESCILGHPRVHLKSLPVLDGYVNKLLMTTGSVTLPNYTDTKAGKKAEFHHTLGFIVVEIDGDKFYSRQVQCDKDGTFYDLQYQVKDGVVSLYSGTPAIVFGDLHLGDEDEESVSLAFEIATLLQPEVIVLHDVMNGHSISHHEQHDPFVLAQREIDGTWDLTEELNNIFKWFKEKTDWNFVNVQSNHSAWIDRWVRNTDWRKASNKKIYLDLANAVALGWAPKGLLPYLLDENTTNVKSLSYNDSLRIKNWEVGLHGDKGASSTRGSITQFKNLNTHTITGHSHSPQREDGAIVVGTLTKLRLGYNSGLSSWANGIVVIYPNGKASHIHFIGGSYTNLK